MRTTVTLAPDVAAAVEEYRRERAVGVSEAVNSLVREGLVRERSEEPFEQRSRPIGFTVDLSNVADALETLDGPTAA